MPSEPWCELVVEGDVQGDHVLCGRLRRGVAYAAKAWSEEAGFAYCDVHRQALVNQLRDAGMLVTRVVE